MSCVTVQCPECQRAFVVNGRGRCTCGTYLVHHFDGRTLTVPYGEQGRPTLAWTDHSWVVLRDRDGVLQL